MIDVPLCDTQAERTKRKPLLQYIFSKCDQVVFLYQSDENIKSMKKEFPKWVTPDYEESAKEDFDSIRPFLLLCQKNGGKAQTVHKYFNNMSFSYPMSVMTVDLNPEIKKELSKYDLLDWNAPNLPQDPCFMKNGKPRFITSTHDEYHFNLIIENQEKSDLDTLKSLNFNYMRISEGKNKR